MLVVMNPFFINPSAVYWIKIRQNLDKDAVKHLVSIEDIRVNNQFYRWTYCQQSFYYVNFFRM